MKKKHMWLLVIVVVGTFFWFETLEPLRRHRQFCEIVQAEFLSLAKKRPPNVDRHQWEGVVAHTLNALANCFTFARNIPRAAMDGFETELHRRLQGHVDLSTIDWVWDEVVTLTPYGKQYSDNWRPTSEFWLAEFAKGNASYGIPVE
jgi:hypothetical protein